MCNLTKNLPIQGGGLLDFQDSGGGFGKEEGKKFRGRPPSELWGV